MKTLLTVDDVQDRLRGLTYSQIMELEKLSGVAWRGLWKIRAGQTPNPGISTVGKFWPHIRAAKRSA